VALFAELLTHHAALELAFAVRPDATAQVRGLIARQLRDREAAVFVFEAAGRVAGFCTVRLEHSRGVLVESARAEIADLGVRPELRRRGAGRALVEQATAWARARGAERVEVRVASRNPEGQAFWRALGYEGFVDVLQRRL
jgi:ribosomal protein S18 acetylase RimI-like enzyme